MRIEHLILKTLIENEEYVRKVIPFIKSEYFTDQSERALFDTVAEYIEKYNSPPSMEAIVIEIDNGNYEEAHFSDIMETMDDISSTSDSELPWLLDQTEKFCQERAIHNGTRRRGSAFHDLYEAEFPVVCYSSYRLPDAPDLRRVADLVIVSYRLALQIWYSEIRWNKMVSQDAPAIPWRGTGRVFHRRHLDCGWHDSRNRL